MPSPTTEQLAELADRIAAEWADKGMLLEGGWRAYVATSGLATAPELQQSEMRKAFFLGAEHLYSCMMQVMDPGEEPTDRDMLRMSLIDAELEKFRLSLVN